jgi:CRISPR-associated endonuclease/helicase Cas3
LLIDHLQSVALLAGDFSKTFDRPCANVVEHLAYLAGLWHDLGKYRSGFQRYLGLADNPDAHIAEKVGGRETTQSAAGALWAIEVLEETHGSKGFKSGVLVTSSNLPSIRCAWVSALSSIS